MKRIVLEIDEEGKITLDAQGFKGKVCMKETAWLEKILGKTQKVTFKKEYHDVDLVKTLA